jgi:NTE family protein
VDDLEGSADYALKANITRTNLNSLGGEWRNDVQIGEGPGLRSELFQPMDFRGHYFVAPWIATHRTRQPLYEEGERIASYTVDEDRVQADLGIEYGRWGEVRLGAYRNHIRARVDTGPPTLPKLETDGGGLAFFAAFDNLDRPAFPEHGSRAFVTGVFARDSLGADAEYDRLEVDAAHFRGRGRHTGYAAVRYGTNLGSTLPPYDAFLLGGLFSLAGYSEGELRGQVVTSASAGYHFRLGTLPPGFGYGVYAGAALDGGNVWESTDDVTLSNLIYGVRLLIGADTLLGPVFFGYGFAEGGQERLYLTLGRTF